jgi:hypothetical protein
VDDTVSVRGAGAQAVEIFDVTAVRQHPGSAQSLSRAVRAGEAEDVVTCGDEF